jgi:hypothetical protein
MPFSGNRERIMYSIQYEEAQPPSILAGEPALARFDAMVLRALKRPQRRYQSASEFRADLLATWARPVGETLSLEALAQMGMVLPSPKVGRQRSTVRSSALKRAVWVVVDSVVRRIQRPR